MKASETIRIENVYYMLAYAFEALRKGEYSKITPEEFRNAEDMFGMILGLGMSSLVKQGLYREYVDVIEDMAGLRGKINVPGTVKHRIVDRPMLTSEHDEFSEDNLFNQILKATALMLFRSNRLKVSKDILKNVLPFFSSVREVQPRGIRWDRISYQRSNRQYLMLMNICRLVLNGMIMSTRKGAVKIVGFDFSQEQLCDLYEAFVREYFSKEWHLPTKKRRINWDVSGDVDLTYLPEMRADIVLEKDDRTLIIDTKFYGSILGGRVGGKVSNDHLYQLLSYVNNYQADHPNVDVSGMLLYAKTTVDDFDRTGWNIGGHRIDVRTLNLDQKFSCISKTLNDIYDDYFIDGNRNDKEKGGNDE